MMTSEEDKELSLLLSFVLDNFGFRKEMVSFRSQQTADSNNHLSLCASQLGLPSTGIAVGSYGEGVALSDSDKDQMIVFDDIVCVDKGKENGHFTIFETDYTSTAPGYTKVVSVHTDVANVVDRILKLYPCKCSEYISGSGQAFISSTVLRNNFIKYMKTSGTASFYKGVRQENITSSGPAITRKIVTNMESFEADSVISIYFYGGQYLTRWKKRKRIFDWPSRENIKEISEMEGYLVPIGDKESDNQHLEWRICYTTAEKKLVSSLNSVQIKLYVLLKMIAKKLLKPQCSAMTSYVVKNVIFWVVEGTPRQQFSPNLLIHLLQKSLYFIKHCLKNNHFPNYMIPERNLLRGAVCGQEKQATIRYISECLHEGGSIVRRIPVLQQCLSHVIAKPESIRMYGTWRDRVEEQLAILKMQVYDNTDLRLLVRQDRSILNDIHSKCMSDGRIWQQVYKLTELLIPELSSLGRTDDHICKLYLTRLRQCYPNPINSGTDPKAWAHNWQQLAAQLRY